MSTILKAYENSIGVGMVERPKALGNLRGVSYIYPIFFRFGLTEVPEKVKEVLRGKSKEAIALVKSTFVIQTEWDNHLQNLHVNFYLLLI